MKVLENKVPISAMLLHQLPPAIHGMRKVGEPRYCHGMWVQWFERFDLKLLLL